MASDPDVAHQLNYGTRPPAFRRWLRLFYTVTMIAVVGALCWFARDTMIAWYEWFREGREIARWYSLAASHDEIPPRLKYSDVPSDAPKGEHLLRGLGNQCLGFTLNQDPIIDRVPYDDLFDSEAHFGQAGNDRVIFVHEMGTLFSKGVIIVVADGWEYNNIVLYTCQVSRSAGGKLGGKYTWCNVPGYAWVDMTGFAKPATLRLFSGRPDASDPTRFYIPFESQDRRGRICGQLAGEITWTVILDSPAPTSRAVH